MLMDSLKKGNSIKGFSVDKAASKIVLPTSDMESIALDAWIDLDDKVDIHALGYVFDLSF